MAALQMILGERVAAGLRRERIFRDRNYPLDNFNDEDMHERYRFTRRGLMRLMDLLAAGLNHPTKRSHAIDGRLQICIALRFYATGTVHTGHGDHHGVSKASACRIVRRVSSHLIRMKGDVIRFPTTPQEVMATQRGFSDVAGFPRIVSAVDCTHVLLKGSRLGEDAYVYINRKRVKSINVQLMCNSRYKITNVVARWPGSAHDSRILQHSNIGQEFEAGNKQGILIGDSGYPLKPCLMTPIAEPQSPAEISYNRAHPRTRVFIEQVNGQLKMKFPCLMVGLHVGPKQACRTIVACAVLFNLAKDMQEPEHELNQHLPDDPHAEIYPGAARAAGLAIRAQIAQDIHNRL
ncbi:putative nuclease HARBI1 [Apostichopus japonicus]|uniref:putative nuclease HARBI1 n=1 Tax=Stichopus japonicus TaxID=307972 RepID=UPI003AB31340